MSALGALFSATRVAVLGVSRETRPSLATSCSSLLKNVPGGGFPGEVFFVNPSRGGPLPVLNIILLIRL